MACIGSEREGYYSNDQLSGIGQNFLAGADFNYRNSSFDGTNVLSGNAYYMVTDTEGTGGDQTAFGARISYPNDRIRWFFGFSQVGENFRPALGFVRRRGIREYFGNWRYRWRPDGAPHLARQVFRAFERAGKDTEPIPGIGLGLALSRGLAQALSGNLLLDPDVEAGAAFRLTLPCPA